jgi:broad specificity phosphatase PhoE
MTSNFVRALGTAKIIGITCDLVPETSSHFVELGRPEKLYGNFLYSFSSLWFYGWWYLGWRKWNGDYAESYQELRERIRKAQAQLETLPADARVVVVSHSAFIGFFVAHRCRKAPLGLIGMFRVFCRIISMPNTGVVHLRYDPESSGRCKWQLVKNALETS